MSYPRNNLYERMPERLTPLRHFPTLKATCHDAETFMPLMAEEHARVLSASYIADLNRGMLPRTLIDLKG
jgi:hypothetical protein